MDETIQAAESEIEITSAQELLRQLSAECRELDMEIQRAIHEQQDVALANRLTVQRAELVASLSERLNELRTRGISVDDRTMEWSIALAGNAKRAIEVGNDFGMSVLLHEKGSTDADPDLLEQKAIELDQAQVA